MTFTSSLLSVFTGSSDYQQSIVSGAPDKRTADASNTHPEQRNATDQPLVTDRPLKTLSEFTVIKTSPPYPLLNDEVDEDTGFILEKRPEEWLQKESVGNDLALKERLAHQEAYNLEGVSTIELPSASGTSSTYLVKKVEGHDIEPGLNAYILYPASPESGSNAPIDIKLVFRGTKDLASVIRDTEAQGAGAWSLEKGATTIFKHLDETLQVLKESHPNRNAKLSISGHSLGGADAQNFAGHLLDRIAGFYTPSSGNDENHQDMDNRFRELLKIVSVDLFTKCSAGTPDATHKRVKSALGRLKDTVGNMRLKFKVLHMKVHGDMVQATGDRHVGAGLDRDKAEVEVLKITPEDSDNRVHRHTRKFLIKDKNQGRLCNYQLDSNKTSEGKKKVKRSLKKTSTLLRCRPVKLVQGLLNVALRQSVLRWC